MRSAALAYKASHASTATPGELVVMLYDGALRFLDEAIRAYRSGDEAAAHQAVVRAEQVVLELMACLDLRYELAQRLLSLYRYLFERLGEARRNRDPVELERLRGWFGELREAWAQAEHKLRTGVH
ncbi:MAG: flagellar export chaperone FliS [Armatimonadota bacterium]|nr:flagellar export chaperone FliS [Armatimonadota bacterium]MDR7444107.1 flagellar export chaperone FliS [Armatimonadota bacterium]MDR7569524.1 flagellar export chaperone FliS [Armatimonadota bacterium]MDR7613556.1 flagellar export chaperone FliS [Armatimonadota bacterium]